MPVIPTVEWEKCVLSVDPFEGDFGDGEVKLSDKMVTSGKLHPACCNICGGPIAKGERHRARVEACRGQLMTFRWCLMCCVAMASADMDQGKMWEARVNLHRRDPV